MLSKVLRRPLDLFSEGPTELSTGLLSWLRPAASITADTILADLPGINTGTRAVSATVTHAEHLNIQGVSKRFGNTPVLKNVSVQVRQGEFVTLLGPSGCGKTTLLRIIAGLEVADSGVVCLGGRDLGNLPANKRPVNTVFQSYALFPHLNVFNNVAFGLRARRIAEPEVTRRVKDALEMLQLTDFATRQTHQLSGGQRQRVALARALVNEPEVLLLDEPMSALDAKLRSELQVELRRLQRRLGKTFILVTHDQDEAMTVSDRILLMRDGQIIQEGPPAHVYEHPTTQFVAQFLGAANLISARKTDNGLQTELGLLHARTTPSWESGTLAIRPERVRVGDNLKGGNMFTATVKDVIYRGDHCEVFFDQGNIRASVSSIMRLAPGENTSVQLPAEHLEVLSD